MIKLYSKEKNQCCPDFDTERWDGKEITWNDKLFVKGSVNNFFYIPPNYGDALLKVRSADAFDDLPFILSDQTSLWGTDIYIAVKKEVPGLETVKLSGKFITKVFKGSLKNAEQWKKEMEEYVKSKGKQITKMYLFHNACPRCKKIIAHGYTAIFAQIADSAGEPIASL